MNSDKSCLIHTFSHYIPIAGDDEGFLAELERDERQFARGDHIYRRGDDIECLHVVRSGWLYSYADLDDGRRQIFRIHQPGDVLGFPDIAARRATVHLVSAAAAVVCPFPRRALRTAFARSPNVAALLFTLALRDQVILTDTVRLLGRMTARERLAFLVLDHLARRRIACGNSETSEIQMPLTQAEIGDHLGLSNVHVSRALGRLEKDGLLERLAGVIRVRDETALSRLASFEDRYDQIDTRWLTPQM